MSQTVHACEEIQNEKKAALDYEGRVERCCGAKGLNSLLVGAGRQLLKGAPACPSGRLATKGGPCRGPPGKALRLVGIDMLTCTFLGLAL
jgi:hypothetical protein